MPKDYARNEDDLRNWIRKSWNVIVTTISYKMVLNFVLVAAAFRTKQDYVKWEHCNDTNLDGIKWK